MSIRKIDTNIGTIPTWGDDDFDENVHENFTSLKAIVPKINDTVDDIDETVSEIVVLKNTTVNSKDLAKTYSDSALESKNSAQNSANIASQKADEIAGYVVPTNATYTPEEIDNKIQTKGLEDFLGFNF